MAGSVDIPGSKSHTIRGLLLGTLATGSSLLRNPLISADTESCMRVCEALGARLDRSDEGILIQGTGGRPHAAEQPVDVGNSGTTLFLALTAAALAEGDSELTGDAQIRARSAEPLLVALRQLGARADSLAGNGCAPLRVGGPLQGGHVSIGCPTSQYLSSLLLSCGFARGSTTIDVPLLNERPYVEMTLQWMQRVGLECAPARDLSSVHVPGGQRIGGFRATVPADFSSATFFMLAAAITRSRLMLRGLDMDDVQGDRAVVGMFEQMGCDVETGPEGVEIAGPPELRGGTFDLNWTPDALPAMAVAGCFARGETRLVNVPQARDKETDRIAVMARELATMGADVEELPDGLVVRHSPLTGARVSGHDDHRVVMALAVAGLAATGQTHVATADAMAITCPQFADLMRGVGALLRSAE